MQSSRWSFLLTTCVYCYINWLPWKYFLIFEWSLWSPIHDKCSLFFIFMSVCPDLHLTFNLGAVVFHECCHTRQKWNLWVCGFFQLAVCVCVSVCVCMCLCISMQVLIRLNPSYPHLLQTALCFTSDACLSLFCSSILSHFLPLWRACSLLCGYKCAHFLPSSWGQKSCAHIFTYTQGQVGT